MRSMAFFALATTGELQGTAVEIRDKYKDGTYFAEVIGSFLRFLNC